MNTTIYLSNLSYKRDRNGIKSLLAPFARIKNIKIVMEPTTMQSRGMAFVELATTDDVKKAMDALNNRIVDGRTLKIKMATPLKATSVTKKIEAEKKQKDLEFRDVQLMKKARNVERRNRKPF
ncbi:MAG: RNA recognition motif domain-containing protein [Bacteriovoracia bacterium]